MQAGSLFEVLRPGYRCALKGRKVSPHFSCVLMTSSITFIHGISELAEAMMKIGTDGTVFEFLDYSHAVVDL